MQCGLQTGFSGELTGVAVLRQVAGRGFTRVRLDVRACSDAAHVARCQQEALDAGLVTICIVDRRTAAWTTGVVEVGNEPELHDWSPTAYLDEVRAVVAARAGMPGLVYAGSIANLNTRGFAFLRAIVPYLPAGVGISVHRYPVRDDFDTPQERGKFWWFTLRFRSREEEVSELKAIIGARPWVVSEFGYHNLRATEAHTAAQIRQEWAFWSRMGCEAAYLFQLNDAPTPRPGEKEDRFGIRRSDGSWKPAADTVPGQRPKPVDVPTRYCRVSVFAAEGGFAPLIGGTLRFDDPTWPVLEAVLEDGRLKFVLPTSAVDGWQVHITAETEHQAQTFDVPLAPDIDVALPPLVRARRGVVRLAGRSWEDADGSYYPLGTTLFWALGGWLRGDSDRVKRHAEWIKAQGADYVRILGQVDWSGEQIDPHHPQYEHALAAVIDAMADAGLRTQITLIGGGCEDPLGLAQKVLGVTRDRRDKIQMLEAVNEGNASEDEAVSVAMLLRAGGVPFGVGLGDQGIETINRVDDMVGSTLSYFHQERGEDDTGTRQVRQVYDAKEFRLPPVWNEPPGPAGSVRELTDPMKLAAMRAGAIIMGAEAYCLHFGAGVFGRRHVSNNGLLREANLWEVPNAAAIFAAVRAADRRLPDRIGGWTKFNDGWAPPLPTAPVTCGGAFKHYGARSAGAFASLAFGCHGPVTFKAREAVHLSIVNPMTGEVLGEHELHVGQSVSESTLWAYVLVGQLR